MIVARPGKKSALRLKMEKKKQHPKIKSTDKNFEITNFELNTKKKEIKSV